MKMNFNNEDLVKVIQFYAKKTGQKFVVDPQVRGKVSIFVQEELPPQEAFNQLSSALSVNGYAISRQGDTMIVKSARNIQRDLIEVSTDKPALKPERMFTWVYQVRNLSAADIHKQLRILPSKDGEMVINDTTNQMIFTDWVSNLHRISAILNEVDIKVDSSTAKIIESHKKQRKKE